MPGGPKLVHLTFQLDEGPRVKIREVTFTGNQSVGDRTLRSQQKSNKQRPRRLPQDGAPAEACSKRLSDVSFVLSAFVA